MILYSFRGTKNLKWITWHDHTNFRYSLSSISQDLLWSTCTPNLKSLYSPTLKIGKAMQNVIGVVGRLAVTQGHWQCHHLIHTAHMTSYSTSIETMHLSCTIFELQQVICQKLSILTYHLCLVPLIGVTQLDFCQEQDLWQRKTKVPGLACGTVCMILRLAILVEHRLVTDRQTDRRKDRQTHEDS